MECYHKTKEQFHLPKKLHDLRKAASYGKIPLEKVSAWESAEGFRKHSGSTYSHNIAHT